jgi:hypothetical protein
LASDLIERLEIRTSSFRKFAFRIPQLNAAARNHVTDSSRRAVKLFIDPLHGRALIDYRPDFDVHTVFQGWALFSDFDRFIQAHLQQEITADRFLDSAKGPSATVNPRFQEMILPSFASG